MFYKKIELFLKSHTVFISLVILTLVSAPLRLFKLGEVPVGITNDEVVFVYNAYSILKTGHDLTGQFLPLITKVVVPYLPVPVYLRIPFLQQFGLSIFSGRMLNAFVGVATVWLLYFLTIRLFKNKSLAFFSALFLAISPWHLQLSRSAYDSPIALFFWLLGGLLFLIAVQKKSITTYILLFSSAISFFMALFSYRATNMIFFPILISLVWFAKDNLTKVKKVLAFFIIAISFVSLLFLLINKSQGTYYTTEAFISKQSPLNMNEAQSYVDTTVANTTAPLLVSRFFVNKLTYTMRVFRENYLEAFSVEYLFTKGEAQPIYSIWLRGSMYLLDLPFLLTGLIYLFKKNRRSFLFVIFSTMIGPLPSALSGPTYGSRSLYMLPFLLIPVAAGIIFLWEYIGNYRKLLKAIILSIVFIFYSLQVSSYLYQYYGRYAIYGAESWFKSTQDVSRYISNHPQNKLVVANAWIFEFINYAFYTKLDPQIAQDVIRNSYKSNQFDINNVKFVSNCLNDGNDDPKSFLPKNTIYITRVNCHKIYEADEYIRKYDGIFTQNSEIIWRIFKSKDLATNPISIP